MWIQKDCHPVKKKLWKLSKQKTRADSRKSSWRAKLPKNDAGSANETANETAKAVKSDTDVINAKTNGMHAIETANAGNETRIDNILNSVFQTAW
jgi:hypothetical protein